MYNRIKVAALVMVMGVMTACGPSGDPNINQAKDNIKANNFDEALQSIDAALQTNPNNGLAYYFKGITYSEIASEQDPSKRQEPYQKSREAFFTADTIFANMEEAPSEAENIGAVRTRDWAKEHNAGVNIVSNDSLKEVKGLDVAVAHLKNATTVLPDSVLSWQVLSEVQFMNENVEGAISAMQGAIERVEQPSLNNYRRLAYFFQQNNQPNEAITTLENASQAYPEEIAVVQDLVNLYLGQQEIDKALARVQELIERDPDNPQYRLVFGTAVYQSVYRLLDEIDAKYNEIQDLEEGSAKRDSLQQQADQLESQIDELTNQAIDQLKKVIEMQSDNAKAYQTLGIIYQNKADILLQERDRTTDNEEANKLQEQALEFLNQSMGYYEQAAELKPENKDIWRSLFQIYTRLDMKEKAEDAMEKAGI